MGLRARHLKPRSPKKWTGSKTQSWKVVSCGPLVGGVAGVRTGENRNPNRSTWFLKQKPGENPKKGSGWVWKPNIP